MPVFPVLGQIGGGIGGNGRGEARGARGTDCHGQSADWSRNDRDARRQIFLVKPIDIVGFMCYHAITYKKDMLKE